jgi:hypothetical protein
MRRLHLLELEDQPWLPAWVRDHMTAVLRATVTRMRLHEPLIGKLGEALRRCGIEEVLDLCSGSGGVLPEICSALREREGVRLSVTFTDRYPNRSLIRSVCAGSGGALRACEQSVDATRVPAELSGFRTMFSGFHHFRPEQARRIIADAVAQGRGIGIFEFSERALWSLLRVSLSPLAVWVMTPTLRPLTWRHWVFAYALPIVPFALLWDGIVSALRTYSCEEMRALADVPGAAAYTWDIGRLAARRGYRLPYMIGYPSVRNQPNVADDRGRVQSSPV